MFIPSKERIPDFIRAYKNINPDTKVDDLIKKADFQIIFEEGESLYFGEVDPNKKVRVGILVTKRERF